jgi:hypothetical protein
MQGQEPKAAKNKSEAENHYHQQWQGNETTALFKHQPARFSEINREC